MLTVTGWKLAAVSNVCLEVGHGEKRFYFLLIFSLPLPVTHVGPLGFPVPQHLEGEMPYF